LLIASDFDIKCKVETAFAVMGSAIKPKLVGKLSEGNISGDSSVGLY
jgi:hypothetical protein